MSVSIATIAAWALTTLTSIGATRPAAVRADYPAIADAFAVAAVTSPVFDGADAEWRTTALFVAIAEAESGFDKKAVNGVGGQQLGLFQIHESNLKALGLHSSEELFDIQTNTYAARMLIKRSFAFCRAAKREESWWLGPFASGRETCDYGIAASKVRMNRGASLFASFPPTREE